MPGNLQQNHALLAMMMCPCGQTFMTDVAPPAPMPANLGDFSLSPAASEAKMPVVVMVLLQSPKVQGVHSSAVGGAGQGVRSLSEIMPLISKWAGRGPI